MKKVKEKGLEQIKGGAISGWTVAGIGILVTFVAGVFDGIVRPKSCGK